MRDIFLINDAPSASDMLKFDRYVGPLAKIIQNPLTKTPFTIGIFGPWGAGKSTLIQFLDVSLEKTAKAQIYRIMFNPWLYKDEHNLVIPLLHTIREQFEKEPAPRFINAAQKVGTIIARIGASLLLKTVTGSKVSIKDFDDEEKAYNERSKRVRSEIKDLRQKLQEVIEEVTEEEKDGKVVIFIDDLDRCQPDQIVALLEALKLLFDLKKCFFILALDDEVIHRAIQIKYAAFDFYKERKMLIGQEYLEKMIQLPLYLYPLGSAQIVDFLNSLQLPESARAQIALLAEVMFPNPRKIKRILNLFMLNLAVLEDDAILRKEIKNDTLARLIVMQVQDYELYLSVVNNVEFAEYLSKLYRGVILLSDGKYWVGLNDRTDVIKKLCEKYYRPGTWIERIFKNENSFPKATELFQYFNMLGSSVR